MEIYRGNRLRQYYKFKNMYNSDEWDEILLNLKYKTSDRKCPICGNKLYYNSWSEEYRGVVENIYQCTRKGCNYKEHEYYGVVEWSVGEYQKRFHGHKISVKEYFTYRHEFEKEIEKTRNKHKQIKRKTGLKYRKRKLS